MGSQELTFSSLAQFGEREVTANVFQIAERKQIQLGVLNLRTSLSQPVADAGSF